MRLKWVQRTVPPNWVIDGGSRSGMCGAYVGGEGGLWATPVGGVQGRLGLRCGGSGVSVCQASTRCVSHCNVRFALQLLLAKYSLLSQCTSTG